MKQALLYAAGVHVRDEVAPGGAVSTQGSARAGARAKAKSARAAGRTGRRSTSRPAALELGQALGRTC